MSRNRAETSGWSSSMRLFSDFVTGGEYAAGELPWRLLKLLNGYRIVASVGLLLLFLASKTAPLIGGTVPRLFYWTVLAYLAFSILAAIGISRRTSSAKIQLSIHLLADIAAVTSMVYASGGVQSGLGSLLVISIGAASILFERRDAIAFAAIAALLLLLQQSFGQLYGAVPATGYAPTGMLGAIFFLIALAGSEVGRRIRESEALAEKRGIDLENLSQLNAYIVQRLRESIVVIDSERRVRLMNESAARHLGITTRATGRTLDELAPALHDIWRHWNPGQDPGTTQPSMVSADGTTLILPRFAPLGEQPGSGTLIFLEDSSLIAEQVQKSKLAALGRLSASIAHEIRNPVGAMSHAAQLLGEADSVTEHERRLIEIMNTHAGRVSEIIENILQLSRRDKTHPQRLKLDDWLRDFADEFAVTEQVDAQEIQIEAVESPLEVRMDPSHLQQVLWNLCQNAMKYGANNIGNASIEMRFGRGRATKRPYLEIADRGAGIPHDCVDQIFEPFYTTESTEGTGLGLFIARELCECNGATLLYEPRHGGGSIFRIIFTDPNRWAAA